jgi:hypothetical protein
MIIENARIKNRNNPLPILSHRTMSVKSHAQNEANAYADKKNVTNTLINVFI